MREDVYVNFDTKIGCNRCLFFDRACDVQGDHGVNVLTALQPKWLFECNPTLLQQMLRLCFMIADFAVLLFMKTKSLRETRS